MICSEQRWQRTLASSSEAAAARKSLDVSLLRSRNTGGCKGFQQTAKPKYFLHVEILYNDRFYYHSRTLRLLPEILPVSHLRRSVVLVFLVVVMLVAILLLALVRDAGGPDGAKGDRDHHGQVEHGVVSSSSSSAAAAKSQTTLLPERLETK